MPQSLDDRENPYAPPKLGAAQPPVEAEPVKGDWKSMITVLFVQAHNVFNDKITQFMLTGLAGVLLAQIAQGTVAANFWERRALHNYELVAAILISLPFVLFAPVSGWIADRYSKRTVLIWCFIIQLVVLAFMIVCLMQHWIWAATAGFFALSIQATLLSPAKMGICKELVGGKKLAVAVGCMQMLVVLSIIIGTVIGGESFKALSQHYQNPWTASWILVLVLFVASVIPLALMALVRKTPVQSQERFHPSMAFEHFTHLADLLGKRDLRRAGLGVTYFWFAGGAIALTLIEVGKELFPNNLEGEAIAITSRLWFLVGVGSVLGSVFVSIVCRRGVKLTLVPAGAFAMAASMLLAAVTEANSIPYYVAMSGMGFFSGVFLVPQNAFIQDRADPEHRGRITSAANLLNSLAGLLAVGFIAVLRYAHVSSAWQFGVLAVLTLGIGFYALQLTPQLFPRLHPTATRPD